MAALVALAAPTTRPRSGRRYAEWAVSAPTLESAVAAAAMAQDELGHARSTYPVLKALGVERRRRRPRRRPPRWRCSTTSCPTGPSFIAANLLVDGVLTTFVAACARQLDRADGPARAQDPPGGGLAPRPRRGVGAAAVPRGRRERDAAASRACARRGSRPARWPGPDDDPGYARRARRRHGRARPRRSSASRCAPGWSRCSPPRACAIALRRAGRLVGLGPRARAG